MVMAHRSRCTQKRKKKDFSIFSLRPTIAARADPRFSVRPIFFSVSVRKKLQNKGNRLISFCNKKNCIDTVPFGSSTRADSRFSARPNFFSLIARKKLQNKGNRLISFCSKKSIA